MTEKTEKPRQSVQERIADKFNPEGIQDMSTGSGGAVSLVPESFGQLMEFSKLMSTTSAVPPHLRGKPGGTEHGITCQAAERPGNCFRI